ncbi:MULTISPECIES: uracil-DNA glycosylase [Acidiplasma]|jgi:uracil-DNA glycosylase family 4|uniref:Type-5 uracil-DNA glycosylase n=1 Tax=Acidiplasma aeolicum TaxID=507754 RepID=A0A0Q0WHD0_9ARCH|nr:MULTISPECIES: uracil-DNA glycosylase [Acidiplasma]KJE49149.1 uracil-DNA glycosylase [Acidiplasma sp. MBA-1]KQB34910.1 uracil-DNA glycosylase [Acidiplasma aeolicum]WMT54915.1 MAG: uracil-DNA glycosylase [Acidiplasma sp.]
MNLNEEIINCRKCPRLVEYRTTREIPRRYSGEIYWSRPVTGYGDIHGKLLVIGLAPAFNGGNRTGRIFTGDKSSDFLISALYEAGFTNIPTSTSRDDGLTYNDMYITLALKCAPPDNIPLKDELINCQPFLIREIQMMDKLRAVLVLGKIAFDSYLRILSEKGINIKNVKFGNELYYDINGIRLYCSYHPSPRNVNTGSLKRENFIKFLREIKKYINS